MDPGGQPTKNWFDYAQMHGDDQYISFPSKVPQNEGLVVTT
jgi:hypothetical protein